MPRQRSAAEPPAAAATPAAADRQRLAPLRVRQDGAVLLRTCTPSTDRKCHRLSRGRAGNGNSPGTGARHGPAASMRPRALGIPTPARPLRRHRRRRRPARAPLRTAGIPGRWAPAGGGREGRAGYAPYRGADSPGQRDPLLPHRPPVPAAAPGRGGVSGVGWGAMPLGLEANARTRNVATFLFSVISERQIQDNRYSKQDGDVPVPSQPPLAVTNSEGC